MRHRYRLTAGFVKLALACIVVTTSIATKGVGQVRGVENPLVRVGADAPDFNLARLTITSDPNGRPIGVIRAADTIRLSSFRGKRPVCLIMSSYT